MADIAGKRGGETRQSGKDVIDENSPVLQAFRCYQSELDTRHDKYERIVKVSRDITIESKRTIFLLQRVTGADCESTLLDEAENKLKQIQKTKFILIAKELQNEEPYRFIRAYSPGLQEYIEAVSFFHYIKCEELVSLPSIEDELVFSVNSDDGQQHNICVHVPPVEYMLGLADLTGELMRLAIVSVGAGDLDIPFKVCTFLRKMQSGFQSFNYVSRELKKKISTLNQSLQKVETACYTLQVRGSEIPKHMLVDVLSSPAATIHIYPDEPMTLDE